MPLYEYRCECGEITETLRKESIKTIKCPECGKKAKRQMSVSHGRVKGYSAYNGYAQDRG